VLEQELNALAGRSACTAGNNPEAKSWQLARDLKAVQKRISRKLSAAELRLTSDEWCKMSGPFLDSSKSPSDYFVRLLAQLNKVRRPTGESVIGDALEAVSKLTESDWPEIPDYADAAKEVRLIVALHRELSLRSQRKDKSYFVSYRAAAKVCEGLRHQEAYEITGALVTLGVIELVNKGKPGVNSREAAEFRYLGSDSEPRDFEL
jgi:hypothetical protein